MSTFVGNTRILELEYDDIYEKYKTTNDKLYIKKEVALSGHE